MITKLFRSLIVVAFIGSPLAGQTSVQAQPTEQQITDAALPLPEDLKAGATVVTYDPTTGARQVLRQGTNQVECQPMDADAMQTSCYSKMLAPQFDLMARLRAEGKSPGEVQAGIVAARQSGTLPPPAFGSMMYALRHDDRRIKLLWVMMVPGATSEALGVSMVSLRDNALKGQGRPWLMRAGTPGAHIMIPINNTPLSSGVR